MRGVTVKVMNGMIGFKFQLTRLMRGVTLTQQTARPLSQTISTHTPHARRDKVRRFQILFHEKFQLTRLMRGVTIIKLFRGVGL